MLQVNETLSLSTQPIVLLLKRIWMLCILCPETLGVIGGLLMSSAEFFHPIGRSGSSVYRFAIWSRWHPLTIFCSLHVTQEKNIEEDRRGCPFVWGWCVDTGTEWRLMGRPEKNTPCLDHCYSLPLLQTCQHVEASLICRAPDWPNTALVFSSTLSQTITSYQRNMPLLAGNELCEESVQSENKYGHSLWTTWTQVK